MREGKDIEAPQACLRRAVALFQFLDELAHVRAQGREQVIFILAMLQHQAAQQLGTHGQCGAFVAAESTLALRGFKDAHPVIVAAVFEFDRAATLAWQTVAFDGGDGDAVTVGFVGHGACVCLRGRANKISPGMGCNEGSSRDGLFHAAGVGFSDP